MHIMLSRPPLRQQLAIGRRASDAARIHQRLPWKTPARRRPIQVRATDDQQPESSAQRQAKDQLIVGASAVGLTLVAALVAAEWREDIEDFIFTSSFQTSGASDFGFGDGVGAALWSLALWYCSPLQLLLLFWGQFERERPSDWVMRQLGQAAGLPVDAVDYSAPLTLRGAALAFTALCGVGTAWAFSLALGDATWSVSSGIGACIASAVYEGGRPSRLDPEKAQLLENQYQDFAAFADVRLQRMGNCHESEVFKAFRREVARYRRPEVLPDSALRDMVRNWHPNVSRTSSGYFKGLSLRPRVDAFTGKATGYAPMGSSSDAGAIASGSSGDNSGLEGGAAPAPAPIIGSSSGGGA